MFELVATLLMAVGVTFAGAAYVFVRRRRQRHDEERLRQATESGAGVPLSLHPVIDTDVCIGSLACVRSCPEGDILGIVQGAGALINGANCIGHGRCAAECPVDAIKLVFGTSQRGVDLPEVDEFFETSRPGVHIVGELGGMGLIKNAMTQGVQAGQRLAEVLSGQRQARPVLVVGAGPAGIGAALALQERSIPFQLVDQQSLGGTVANYPRQKIVMTDRVALPIVGRFGKKRMSKEDLLRGFTAILDKTKLPLTTGVKVERIEGADGDFRVQTSRGELAASKVVLAIGRRGTPRRIGAPGEDLDHVTYSMVDAEQYAGAAVLVVGGGDSALEAAIQLAAVPGTRVTMSYRGPDFVRCRTDNRAKIAALIDDGRVRALFKTNVVNIAKGESMLALDDGSRVSCSADYVVVLIGGELPLEFLKANGIEVRRYHGEALGEKKAARGEHDRAKKAQAQAEARGRLRLAILLAVLGVLIVAALWWVGADYYLLERRERLGHPQHARLRSSGSWGHGVGLVATAFMLANFFYALRKRWSPLQALGNIRRWLTVHMFVGFMSPAVIAFHAAFQSNNVLATATSVAVMVVVGTGVIGRYIFGWVPATKGRVAELGELRTEFERLRARAQHAASADRLFAEALRDPVERGGLLALTMAAPLEGLRFRWHLMRARRAAHLPEDVIFDLAAARRLSVQIGFYRALRRLLSVWRVFHVVLAVFLVLAIALHVGVTVYLGYGWGWSKA